MGSEMCIRDRLWLYGHGGGSFEVYDDIDPFGRPGGLALTGRVRNWARLVNDKLSFDKDAPSNPDLTPVERDMIARAAGKTPSRPGEARTAATHPSDGSEHPQGQDDASAGIVGPQTPVAVRGRTAHAAASIPVTFTGH